MRTLTAILAGILFFPGLAQATVLEDILAGAAKDCAGYDNGVFELRSPPTQVDLTGDGVPETILDEGTFSCSSSASFYGGTGGSMIHVINGDVDMVRLARDWTVHEWNGKQVLLLYLHGSECFGAGMRPCVEALVWGDDGFASVRTPAEGE